MLGRTASSMFWIARYMERVENLARLLEVGYRISLTPGADGSYRSEWESTLTAAACLDGFREKYETADQASVVDFLLFDRSNPSSVRSCLEAARNNGRSVRIALTSEMWEALNSAYMDYSSIRPGDLKSRRIPELLDWVRGRALLFRGAMLGTILRNAGYYFSQLGAFVERADQTARILDVKYYILLPRQDMVGGDIDTYQWETILRSVSAHRSYRHVYHDTYRSRNIAEFLILRPEMPRSLHHCYGWINSSLDGLSKKYGTSSESLRVSDDMIRALRATDMEMIFRDGLHEFLTRFIQKNNSLAEQISKDFHFA